MNKNQIILLGGGTGTSLPTQSGQNGKFLTTDGSSASWGTPAGAGDMVLASVQVVTALKTFGAAGAVSKFALAGSTSGSTIINASAVAGAGTWVVPTGSDTFVGLAAVQSLTNKKLGSLTSNGLVTTSGGDGTLSETVPGANVLIFLATPSSANLGAALTTKSGSGLTVFDNAPSFQGVAVHAGGDAYTPNAMGALVIDVTKTLNTKSISVDSTFTFSGTPANNGQSFGLQVINTDTNAHTLTIPSSISPNRGATITSTTIPASSRLLMQWSYDTGATAYTIYGDPVPTTGSGSYALATNPILVAPTLGAASATSVNKWVFTAPTTASTLASGVDNATYTLPGQTCNIGYKEIPANSQSAAYTTVLLDSGKSIDHPAADANARTFTIDSNANVAYAVGTCISFSNMTAQVVSIGITSDTMYLAGTGSTGTRSLAQYGVATARKILTTTWLISGTGLT